MATNISSTDLESDIASDIATRLGASCKLRHFDGTDTLLAEHTGGTAAANTATSPDSVDITGLSSATASAGTVSYSVLTTSANSEIIRFTAPVSDIGLSSATFSASQTVTVNSLSVIVPA